jgi:MFS family permease
METPLKDSTQSTGRFRSLGIRNYKLYFIGQAISLCGTWMQTIGQDWLVLSITHSGTQLGIVSAFQFLPILILGPLGGVLADRYDKRKILYFTQSFAGVLALILGILVATHTVQIWMIYILALGLGLSSATDYPARQTFVSEMVGKDLLSNAIVLNSTEVNLARAIGPALAGVIIASLGIAPCFIINGLSYIAVIVVLSRMRKSELQPAQRSSRVKGQLKAGFQYVRKSPILLYSLIMIAVIGTFSYEFSVSLPLLAQFSFHGGAGTYSALVAATGTGSVIGGIFATGRNKATPKMLVFFSLLFGITFSLVAFMPNATLAFIMLLLVGVSSINFISIGNTILQLESAPEMRGRVMSLWTMAFLGSTPIGGPIIGWIGEHAGPRYGVFVGGIAAILAAGLGAMTLLKVPKTFLETSVDPSIRQSADELSVEEDMKMR